MAKRSLFAGIFDALGFGDKLRRGGGEGKLHKERTLRMEPLECRQLLSVGADPTATLARTALAGTLAPSLSVSGNAAVGQSATYTLQLSSAVPLSGLVVAWGDGSTDSLPGSSSADTHSFTATPGRYTVTVTATADSNATGIATLHVLVLPGLAQPPASQTSQASGGQGDGDPTGGHGLSGQWADQDDQQSQQQTGSVTISGGSFANDGSAYLLNLPAEDASGNAITAWQISWGDSDQMQSISGARRLGDARLHGRGQLCHLGDGHGRGRQRRHLRGHDRRAHWIRASAPAASLRWAAPLGRFLPWRSTPTATWRWPCRPAS